MMDSLKYIAIHSFNVDIIDILLQSLRFEVKGQGANGMRLSFSETEGEEKISKRYLISHSVQAQFKMAYNDDWGLVTKSGSSAQLMSSDEFKSYIIRLERSIETSVLITDFVYRFSPVSGGLQITLSLVVGEAEEEIFSWSHTGGDPIPVRYLMVDTRFLPHNNCDPALNGGSCCTPAAPCGLWLGDCDRDTDCAGDLVCGTDNCPAGSSTMDCCVGNRAVKRTFAMFHSDRKRPLFY